MDIQSLIKAYSDYLNTLNIHVLRNVARCVGVYKPTDGKKNELIERTIAVLIGTVAPVPQSKRGAPLKEDVLDPKYMQELKRIRDDFEILGGDSSYKNVLKVASGNKRQICDYDRELFMGVLEVLPNGCGYLRVRNCQITPGKDIFISFQNLRLWKLREGDYVVGYAEKQEGNQNPTLIQVVSVNALADYQNRKPFESFTVYYPEKKIEFSKENDALSLRYIDLFAPIGKGQRAIIVSPPSAGATTLLRDIARSVQKKVNRGENFHLLALLVNEKPEEITDFLRNGFKETFYTSFDKEPQEHLRIARMIFARAQRLAEMGEDVILLLDSLTGLTYAANACTEPSKMLVGGLDAAAFQFPKECLKIAGKLNGGGSVTIIAVVQEDMNNAADELIRSEFEKICNCEIILSRILAQKRIFPAIDVKNSRTGREQTFLSENELRCVDIVRENLLSDNGERLYSFMRQFSDNVLFIDNILKNS